MTAVERTGWAAAIGSIYQLTNGKRARVKSYAVAENINGVIHECITGTVTSEAGGDVIVQWDGNGKNILHNYGGPDPQYDLANQIRPGGK